MSVRVWRHPRAYDDLLEVWLYIARDNVAAADKLLESIEAKCRLLVDHPAIGPARDDIGIHTLTIGRYLVLYRIGQERVEIVRVVHGAKDLRNLV